MGRPPETARLGDRLRLAVRRHPVLAVITACYFVAVTAYGSAVDAAPTVPYALIVAAMAVAVAAADARVGFSTVVLGGLAAWGFRPHGRRPGPHR